MDSRFTDWCFMDISILAVCQHHLRNNSATLSCGYGGWAGNVQLCIAMTFEYTSLAGHE